MQVEYSIQYASASDLTELASIALTASRPPGFIPASETVTFESETDPTSLKDDDGSMRWTIRAEQELVQQVNSAYVTQLIQGLGSSAAQDRLDKYLPLVSEPKVLLSPSWWPWVPIVPFRIEVITQ